MFESSVGKDMRKITSLVESMLRKKGGGNREGNDTFMSNTNCQDLKISVEHGRMITTLNIIKH